MIDLLVISRIASDYFWEQKLLSILSAGFFVFLSLSFFLLNQKKFKFTKADFALLAFICVISLTEIINNSRASTVELAKFYSFCAIYFAGRAGVTSLSNPKAFGSLAFASLLIFFTAAFLMVGYQYWGSILTYSGGYYFKTDMAISAMILLAILTSTHSSKFILFSGTALAAYIIFQTNSRIAIPLAIAIPIFASLLRACQLQKLNIKMILYILLTTSVGMSIFMIIDFKALGLLAFDFSDPFSDANTQGRSEIWSAVLGYYKLADPLRLMIGSGLGADIVATTTFSTSEHLQGIRTHNSYLYLLLCTGIIGTTLFLSFLFLVIRRVSALLKNADFQSLIMANLFCTFTLIFLWTSLTTEIIIRPQLMVLVFYFSGIIVQRSIALKKRARSHYVENSTGA